MKNILYIGLDVHKDSIYLCALPEKGEQPIAQRQITNSISKLLSIFKKWIGNNYELNVCYEAGCVGYTIARELQKVNINCSVIAPSKIPQKTNYRIKTDRIDSLNLATMLRGDLLTPIYIPDEEDEAVRDFLRSREDIRNERTRMRQRLSGFLLRHNTIYTEGKTWTIKFYTWLKKIKFSNEMLAQTLSAYIGGILLIDQQIESMNNRIKEIANSPKYAKRVLLLCSLKGISTITALSILCEIGDFRRFESAPKMMSALGLVPSIHASGNSVVRGRITKTGNSHLRSLLIEGCWSYRYYSRGDGAIKAKRECLNPIQLAYVAKSTKYLENKHHHLVHKLKKPTTVATTAVARELIGFIWGLMNNKIN